MTSEVKQTTTNLEVLESKAERALEKAETGWREFAETMREIKESEAHKEAGYRFFRPYYRDRWEPKTGKAFSTLKDGLEASLSIEEMEAVTGGVLERYPGKMAARILKHSFPDATERVGAWHEHLESGRKMGGNREGLLETIAEYKGEGVIERAEAAGVPVPPEPKGKTPAEAAWLAMAEASRLIRGVDPHDAARVEKGQIAARYQEQMWELANWARLFAHEVNAYTEETLSIGASAEAETPSERRR